MPLYKPTGMTRTEWMIDRFWAKVDKRGEDECWPWLGSCVTDGYGTISFMKGWPVATHRLAWEIKNGHEVPTGMQVCHSCDNPPCCNAKHLFLGTNLDNIQDMINKRRGSVKLTKEQANAIRLDPDIHRVIAAKYGVSPSLVCHIKSGNRWKG